MQIKSVLKSSIIVTLSRFLSSGFNFLFLSIVGKILSLNNFGEFSTWITALNFSSTFFLAGTNVSFIYFSKTKDERNKNFILILKTLSFLFIFILFLFFLLGKLNFNIFKGYNFFYSLLLAVYFVSILSIITAYYQVKENFNLYSLFNLMPYFLIFLTAFLIYILFRNNSELKLIINLYILDYVFVIFIGILFLFRENILRYLYLLINKEYLSISFIKYGLKATSLLLISQVLYASDIFILKFIKGNEEVSFYFVAVAFSKITWLITDSIGNVIFPKLTKLKNNLKRNKEINSSLIKLLIILFIINLLFVLFFMIFGNLFIKIFFNIKYINSFKLILILVVASYGMSIYKIYSRKFAAINIWKDIYTALIIATLLNILLNFILIPNYSGFGAAIASLISYWLCGIYLIYRNKIVFN